MIQRVNAFDPEITHNCWCKRGQRQPEWHRRSVSHQTAACATISGNPSNSDIHQLPLRAVHNTSALRWPHKNSYGSPNIAVRFSCRRFPWISGMPTPAMPFFLANNPSFDRPQFLDLDNAQNVDNRGTMEKKSRRQSEKRDRNRKRKRRTIRHDRRQKSPRPWLLRIPDHILVAFCGLRRHWAIPRRGC